VDPITTALLLLESAITVSTEATLFRVTVQVVTAPLTRLEGAQLREATWGAVLAATVTVVCVEPL
jgi:hypothetical protein